VFIKVLRFLSYIVRINIFKEFKNHLKHISPISKNSMLRFRENPKFFWFIFISIHCPFDILKSLGNSHSFGAYPLIKSKNSF